MRQQINSLVRMLFIDRQTIVGYRYYELVYNLLHVYECLLCMIKGIVEHSHVIVNRLQSRWFVQLGI